MYFGFRTFFRIAWLSFFEWKSIPAPFGCRRIMFLVGFFLIFPAIQIFNSVCLLLDNLFFPGYRNIELIDPIFIVGNPRSGTTFIHRLMARDDGQFFSFKAWEIIFPAIIQKKALSLVGHVDRCMGNILTRLVHRVESRVVRGLDEMHKTGLFYPEEDEMLLIHIFSSFIYQIWFFPFHELDWVMYFDHAAKPRDRKRIMTFYKNCVKRQAYFKDNRGRLLSKNPAFSSKIDSLYEYFPGCKIIYMARNPLEAIPSMENMAHEMWRSTIDIKGGYPFKHRVYEFARFFYEYPLSRLDQVPKSSCILINYDDLVKGPSRVIQMIYQRFGLDITTKYLERLKQDEEKARSYKSGHIYSIDQFGLSREEIISDLSDVFIKFGFDTNDTDRKTSSLP